MKTVCIAVVLTLLAIAGCEHFNAYLNRWYAGYTAQKTQCEALGGELISDGYGNETCYKTFKLH